MAADGELRQAGRTTRIHGLAVGLGAFGIVVRVTLDIQPSYLVRQDGYAGLRWDRVLADLEAVMSAGYSVSLFTDWSGDSIRAAWVKRRVGAGAEAAVADELGGGAGSASCRSWTRRPTTSRSSGPRGRGWSGCRISGSTPRRATETRSSRSTSSSATRRAALAAVRRRAHLITPLLRISEIRSTAADQLWLSGSYGPETLAIHFTWHNRPDEVDAVVREVEAALDPFAARPHWGKVTTSSPARLAQLYPRLADARDLFEKLDPAGRFSNRRLERLGVRDSAPVAWEPWQATPRRESSGGIRPGRSCSTTRDAWCCSGGPGRASRRTGDRGRGRGGRTTPRSRPRCTAS